LRVGEVIAVQERSRVIRGPVFFILCIEINSYRAHIVKKRRFFKKIFRSIEVDKFETPRLCGGPK